MSLKRMGIFMRFIQRQVVVISDVIIKREWPDLKHCWANGRNMKRIRYWLIMPIGDARDTEL